MKWLYLMMGGSIGTVARYAIANNCRFLSNPFYGTITVNLIGCFLIGLIVFILEKNFPGQINLRLFLIVGFLGAFTTFSTFVFDTAFLLNQARLMHAFLNIFVSVLGGFVCFVLGAYLAKMMSGG